MTEMELSPIGLFSVTKPLILKVPPPRSLVLSQRKGKGVATKTFSQRKGFWLQERVGCWGEGALFTPQIFTDSVPRAGPMAKDLGSGPAFCPLLLSHSSRP